MPDPTPMHGRPDPWTPIAAFAEDRRTTYTVYCNRLERVTRTRDGGVRERRFTYLGGLEEVPEREAALRIDGIVTLWAVIPGIALGVILSTAGPGLWMSPQAVVLYVIFGLASGGVAAMVRRGGDRTRHVFSRRAVNHNIIVPDFFVTERPGNGAAAFIEAYTRAHRAWQERCKALGEAMQGRGSDAETLRQFARLREDGIIDDDDFARIKAKIVDGTRRSVGFQ